MNSIRLSSFVPTALRQRRGLAIGSVATLVLIIVAVTAYSGLQNQGSSAPTSEPALSAIDTNDSGMYNTAQPERVSDASSVLLLGSVLSHESANIYPRRDGIVEDIYVDIGDSVKKGQAVALLLPQGVEGQSAAIIAEKQARKQQADADLQSAEAVAQETLINTRQKINEMETELEIARREQESLLEKFADGEAHVSQMQEQSFTAVRSARQVIEQLLLGTNSRPGSDVYEDDILEQLGLLNTQTRYALPPLFNEFYRLEQQYVAAKPADQDDLIVTLFASSEQTLQAAITILNATPTVPTPQGNKFTEASLATMTNRVLDAQDGILKAKERLQDAQRVFDTLTAAEPDLYRAYRSGHVVQATSNAVKMYEEQLRTAENNYYLTEANQQQMVERQRNQAAVAEAMLRAETAQTGHRYIYSPFTGTVSKRFIDVGKIVMPSMPAFELTNVPTSLAKKAKAEIQFGLPEDLIGAIDVGDTVTFFLQADETQQHTAEVTRKSPQVDMQTHTVTIQAKLPDDLNLPHQTSVRIRLTDDKKPVFRVPSAAVKREGERNVLWIIDPATDEPIQIAVSVLAEEGEFAELTGDISVESEIILDPPDLFLDADQR